MVGHIKSYAHDAGVCFEEGQTEIRAEQYARRPGLEEAAIPEGITSIGDGAFRGCTRLASITLPSTLQSIGTGAFSCTCIRTLRLPANCTDIAADALRTGPVFPRSSLQPYKTTIERIDVHPDNAVYSSDGAALLRRQENEDATLVFAVRSPEKVTIPPSVKTIDACAFVGTVHIGYLKIHDALSYDASVGLIANASCSRLAIALTHPCDGYSKLDLELPDGNLGHTFINEAFSSGNVDITKIMERYDAAVMAETPSIGRDRRIAARLAAPALLDASTERAYREELAPHAQRSCLQLGERNEWDALENLVAARVLSVAALAEAIGRLADAGYALAAGRLLEAKGRHFGKVTWDYAL